jgi:hypothetical protein
MTMTAAILKDLEVRQKRYDVCLEERGFVPVYILAAKLQSSACIFRGLLRVYE